MVPKVLDLLAFGEGADCRRTSLLEGVTPLAFVIVAKPAPELEAVSGSSTAEVFPLTVHAIGQS